MRRSTLLYRHQRPPIVWEKINFKSILNNDFIPIIDTLLIGFRVMNLFTFNIPIPESYFALISTLRLILFTLMFRLADCMSSLKKPTATKYVDFERSTLSSEFFLDALI